MIIIISALMLAASLVACMKPGKNDNIVNYDYIER
jgi:hypothetical protein